MASVGHVGLEPMLSNMTPILFKDFILDFSSLILFGHAVESSA